MTGTEKQIPWATEIRSNVVKTYTNALPILKSMAPSEEAYTQIEGVIQARIEALLAEDVYAGDIIGLFGDIRFDGDSAHDFEAVNAVYNVVLPHTTGQRTILGR